MNCLWCEICHKWWQGKCLKEGMRDIVQLSRPTTINTSCVWRELSWCAHVSPVFSSRPSYVLSSGIEMHWHECIWTIQSLLSIKQKDKLNNLDADDRYSCWVNKQRQLWINITLNKLNRSACRRQSTPASQLDDQIGWNAVITSRHNIRWIKTCHLQCKWICCRDWENKRGRGWIN